MDIAQDDPARPDVAALLAEHLAFAAALSPPEDMHALDGAGLNAEGVSFFSAREHGELLGLGALRVLSAEHVELKSMHTAAGHRGRGVGRRMLSYLVTVARERGASRVSLETGSMAEFAPARALYASAGFVECAPFGDYVPSRYSTFMTLVVDNESA